MFLNWKLFVFADDGFVALVQNSSVGPHVIILGYVIDRGGIPKCPGLAMVHRFGKIHRVCRSTLAAEAHAAVTAVDAALGSRWC